MEAIDGERARAFVLAKQGLGAVPGPSTVLEVVEATGGVYGTAPTCYLACAARLDGFRVADLDHELYTRRSLVRLRCMRGSAYIEPADDLPAIFAATRDERDLARVVKAAGIGEAEYGRLAAAIEAALRGREPATVAEIRELIGDPTKALSHVVGLMGRQGRLARATVRGGWKSDVYAYALWEEWVGEPLSEAEPVDARAQLARRYLAAYGPASAEDLRWWAGWRAGETRAALAALDDEVATVDVDGSPALVLASETEALAATEPDAGRGTRLLPVWDSYYMGYRDRSRQVRAQDYANVYDKAGNGTSVGGGGRRGRGRLGAGRGGRRRGGGARGALLGRGSGVVERGGGGGRAHRDDARRERRARGARRAPRPAGRRRPQRLPRSDPAGAYFFLTAIETLAMAVATAPSRTR